MDRFCVLLFCLVFASACSTAIASDSAHSSPDRSFLTALPDDIDQPHEADPEGVPGDYDWKVKGKRDRWNDAPSNFSAITGWGQAFWVRGPISGEVVLQLRNHQTWMCESGVWKKVQASLPTGAQFRADFAGNAARKPKLLEADGGVLSVIFDRGTAFHFWPSEGRASLAPSEFCGIRVLIQARVVPSTPGTNSKILLGLGADYWLNKEAPWDNYKTNYAVGVGRLRLVTTEWKWFGFGTQR